MKNRTTTTRFHLNEVVYAEHHWALLHALRESASEVMEALKEFSPMVYGSLARGDVHKDSDVDIVIPYVVPSCLLEHCLETFSILERRLTQATPWYVIKGLIQLPDATVTFPLVEPTRVETEFYRFGGFLTLEGVQRNERAPGVDKRLVFIDPTAQGHKELSVYGREHEVAKRLNISIDIITERMKVLQRRDKVGRTGIFLNKLLLPDETFESVLKDLVPTNFHVRRRTG